MYSKQTEKLIKALQTKKFRQKYNKFIAEGYKIVSELCTQNRFVVEHVIVSKGFTQQYQNESFLDNVTQMDVISDRDFAKISALQNPQGILAVVEILEVQSVSELELSGKWSIYLDRIQDPGNFGTIIRTAEWFGVNNIIASAGCSDFYNPKVIQATMGSFLRANFYSGTLSEVRQTFPSVPIVGAALDGDILEGGLEVGHTGVLAMGNESKGLSAEDIDNLSHRLKIASHPDSKAESLNVAIATGVFLSKLMA